jgi:hypothetical protein
MGEQSEIFDDEKQEKPKSKNDEVDILWDLGIPKDAKGKWRFNNWPIVRGDYGDLERAWSTVTQGWSDEKRAETLKDIELTLPEQSKMRKLERESGAKVPQPKLIAAYIRAKRWMDTIGSFADKKTEIEKNRCQCGQVVFRENRCEDCYYRPQDIERVRRLVRDAEKIDDRIRKRPSDPNLVRDHFVNLCREYGGKINERTKTKRI